MVDIDWEYPGGNGDDYRKVPNSQKTGEIETYPLFLEAIRDAIGKDKILSVAVPGKRGDMIAFTKEQGPKIWSAVDMVNVMSYDLMNRRDNVTNHHTGVAGSLDTIKAYEETGLDTAKMNLGFAYYAKWFTTDPNSDCAEQPIGCAVVPLESPDGSDPGKSGVLTFEKSNMAAPPDNLRTSSDGTCGYAKGTKCPSGSCCSQYGNWYVFFGLSSLLRCFWAWLIRTAAPAMTSARQAVSLTMASARAFPLPIPGTARSRTARRMSREADSTTGTARPISSGPGIPLPLSTASSRKSWMPRSWAVSWLGVWVRIL
jgi:chitinase